MTLPCRYAIVQFMPYAETGEFANVGAVLFCPAQRYFDFRLTPLRARITQFFRELETVALREALKGIDNELTRLRTMLGDGLFRVKDEIAPRIFDDLVRPREALVRFGAPRAVLAADPAAKLEELFAHYVGRNFVTKTYREQLIEKNVRQTLRRTDLLRLYEKTVVGADDFSVLFPFVHKDDNGRAVKVIKPLNLAHAQGNDILDHGGHWVDRIGRLKRRHALPSEILFVTDKPTTGGRRLDAYREVEGELKALGAEVIPQREENRIRQFAEIVPHPLD